MENTIKNRIDQIIKGKEFKFDKTTGYFYINNDIDDTYLFEYFPANMILYVSTTVTDYLIHCGLTYNNDSLNLILSNIFNMNFYFISINKNSTVTEVKFNKLYNTLLNKKFDKKLNLPKEYLEGMDKIELILDKEVKPINPRLNMNKYIKSNFDSINISDMKNGVYSLFLYKKNIYNGRRLRIEIENK